MINRIKEGLMILSHQIKNISKETEIMKKNQMEIRKLKST